MAGRRFLHSWQRTSPDVDANAVVEDKRAVHFWKGRNKLFFKLSNGPTRLFFSLVLTK